MRNYKLYFVALCMLMMIATSVSAGNWFTDIFGSTRGIRGSGDLVSEDRDVKAFSKIRTSGSYDIVVVVGREQSIKVTFDDNLIDIIETDVKGRTLRIYSDESYRTRRDCLIEITVPELKGFVAKGSGDIEIRNMDGEFFEFDLKGSGDIEMEGMIDELEINLAGSGDIDARDLIARDAIVVIKGSGDIRVHATEILDAAIYGSGDIDYYGKPDDVSKHVAGSGNIKRRK
ncbi:MAG: DUF2807 domain-containing protein [candidate division Zixibacteria bacterium]|nr:DUF2807 domain-containing protein [candidate division Zixibacteria bacterium]